MTTPLQRLKADLAVVPGEWRVLVWTGFDQEPFADGQFREYLISARELGAALSPVTGQPPPAPKIIRVVVNGTANVRVRTKPDGGEIVGKLLVNTTVDVYELQEKDGWWTIAAGEYAGKYISAGLATVIKA